MTGWKVAFVAALLVGGSATATAQFFIQADIAPDNNVTCTATGFSSGSLGTIQFHLPDASSNLVWLLTFNGGPTDTLPLSMTPPDQTDPGPILFSGPLPPGVTLPFTLVWDQFPAIGGLPVGRGFRITLTCPASGPGTTTFQDVVAATAAATPVPAMSSRGLATMGALLALSGLAFVRRRRRTSSRA